MAIGESAMYINVTGKYPIGNSVYLQIFVVRVININIPLESETNAKLNGMVFNICYSS